MSSADQKAQAIETHSLQAAQFASSYQQLAADAYRNCFTYSRHRLDALLDPILAALPKGARILDLGCGTGHHLARLRAQGFAVAGVDGSAAMLDEARRANPGALLRQGDVEAIPWEAGSFDAVLSIEVLRYLPDPGPCFREIARVLRPGGVALLTAAPLLSLNGYVVINRLAGRLPLGRLVRLRQFFTTSWRMRRELRAAGFAAATVHGVYFGPVNWVERLARPLTPGFLRAWEALDRRVADRAGWRELSNMFLVEARRDG